MGLEQPQTKTGKAAWGLAVSVVLCACQGSPHVEANPKLEGSSNEDSAHLPSQDPQDPPKSAQSPEPDPDPKEEPEASFPTPEPSPGPSSALFEPHRVLDVKIELDPKDWKQLRHQGRDFGVLVDNCESKTPTPNIFDYFEAKVIVDGQTIDKVGVRKKGFLGSLSVARPSLKLKLNEYVKTQRFEGSRRLTLNNNFQDVSLIRSCLAYEAFRLANLPSPRCNYAIVSVNGEELGVYTHIESIRKPFLRRSFGPEIGDLFESQAADFVEDLVLLFEPKLGEKSPDHSQIKEVAVALGKGDEEIMRSVERIFDLDELLRFWAMESVVSHWDGFAGSRNNVYLYRSPKDDKLHFIPWGADTAFTVRGSVIGTPPDDRASVYLKARLSRELYGLAEIKSRYQSTMRELMSKAWDPDALVAYVDKSANAIRAASGTVDLLALEDLKRAVRSRQAQISADVGNTHMPKQEILDTCPEELGDVSIEFATNFGSGKQRQVVANQVKLRVKGKEVPVTHFSASSSTSFGTGRLQPGLFFTIGMRGAEPIKIELSVEPFNFKSGSSFETQGIATMGTAKQGGAAGFRGVLANGKIHLKQAGQTPGAPVSGTMTARLLKAVEVKD